jgi:hypothetical protein
VTPAQPSPATTPAIRQPPHRPLLLGPCRPSSPPWPATAAPAPPPTARRRAPNTAGQHDCRTAVRRCGRPGSANRRSAGCTETGRRAWANKCSCGPCRSRIRAGWRSPRAGGSSGRSPGVTALGLVARVRPTHLAGGHGQVGAASRFHRTLPPVKPAGHGLDTAGHQKAQPPSHALPWRTRTPGGELPSKELMWPVKALSVAAILSGPAPLPGRPSTTRLPFARDSAACRFGRPTRPR